MVSLRDLQRLANGLSLVAKEGLSRLPNSQTEDFIKAIIISAADVAGLTKGKIRSLEKPATQIYRNGDANTKRDSVVYFTNDPPSELCTPESEGHHPKADSPKQFSEPELENCPELPGGALAGISHDQPLPTADFTPPKVDVNPVVASDASISDGKTLPTADISPPKMDVNPVVTSSVSSVAKKRRIRERRVPSTSFSRAIGFAGLGADIAWGTLQESARRIMFGRSSSEQHALSPFLSERNAERLALALCRMRGAALKIGQMLSIQDESLLPAPILAALEMVRQGADKMPRSQLNQVLDADLGPNWSTKLRSFDYDPMAAASIGQVHRVVMKDGLQVAMKIQYPGVADSIESDIENVKLLLKYTNLIPEKLFLDNAMKVAKEELSRECDYELEAQNQKRFRNLLKNTEGFYVPFVVDDLSSKRVLTTELVPGIPIDQVGLLDQETRNYVGQKLLELTLMELFVFRFMQTDPNWSNFLYDEEKKSINLIDFGAARDYPKHFVDDYLRMVLACANRDRDSVIELSRRLGFLTGEETDVMLDAHVQAGFVVGIPFLKTGGYAFGTTSITQNISSLGGTMLKHRLTPPPEEAYSLHRKLSGAFLACIKLKAVVPCRELLLEVYTNHEFGEESDKMSRSSV